MGAPDVKIRCPSLTCRKVLAVPASARGKTVRCRGCGTSIRIPATDSDATKAEPAPPRP